MQAHLVPSVTPLEAGESESCAVNDDSAASGHRVDVEDFGCQVVHKIDEQVMPYLAEPYVFARWCSLLHANRSITHFESTLSAQL